MRTIDCLPMSYWPSPLALDVTPAWQRLLFGRPRWRFRYTYDAFFGYTKRQVWIYLTDEQYQRIFGFRRASR